MPPFQYLALPEKKKIDTHRINDAIRITPVRVVDEEGNVVGIVPTADALTQAREAGLDLVEVAPNVRPPVCRIMDYGKFKYEQKKKLQKNSKQKTMQVKEIRLRPKTGAHDIEFKVNRARKFLEGRDKVKVFIFFRGREHAHQDRGREMLLDVIENLEDIAKVESPPKMEGGRMSMVLAPR